MSGEATSTDLTQLWVLGRTDAERTPDGRDFENAFFTTPSIAEIHKKGSNEKLSRLLSWSQKK